MCLKNLTLYCSKYRIVTVDFLTSSSSVIKRSATFVRRLGKAATPDGGGMRAMPRLCNDYLAICITTEENHGKF
jgi:hypothetical protein